MGRPSIITRPAVLGDYDNLCGLWEKLDEQHYRALPHLFRRPKGPRRTLVGVQALIERADSDIIIAESIDNELLGLATLLARSQPETPVRPERRYVEIDDIVVKDTARRMGVGRKLVQAAADWGDGRGLRIVELNVHDFNEAAKAFYRSMGFDMSSHRMRR